MSILSWLRCRKTDTGRNGDADVPSLNDDQPAGGVADSSHDVHDSTVDDTDDVADGPNFDF